MALPFPRRLTRPSRWIQESRGAASPTRWSALRSKPTSPARGYQEHRIFVEWVVWFQIALKPALPEHGVFNQFIAFKATHGARENLDERGKPTLGIRV